MANVVDDFKENQPESVPTVIPAKDFDVEADTNALRKAMKGFGTNEDAIIDIVSSRSTEQLKEVSTKYSVFFCRNLLKDLEGELSGKLETVVLSRFLSLNEYHATCLRKAMKGLGTNEKALVGILCTRTNAEMLELKETYNKLFDRQLEADVVKEVSGDLEKILVSVLTGDRSDVELDETLAVKEANELFEAGVGRLGTTESTFNRIFGLRSFSQLRATFAAYAKIEGTTIESAIQKEMSGYVRDAFLTIFYMATDPVYCYTKNMHDAMKGAGTDDGTLMRMVLSHCEVDLLTIRGRFQAIYGEELRDWVEKETSGDYRKILVALVNNPVE